ncbi:MAG: hypothetical protein ABI647_27195 [Gemmatimonadota bacterium]
MTNEQKLARARAIHAEDPTEARRLRHEVAAGDVGVPWSNARVDLASELQLQANSAGVIELAEPVLAAPVELVDPAARAVAGVLVCDAREILDLEIDEALLESSVTAASAAGQHYYAGAGLAQHARLLLFDHKDRVASKRRFAEAVAEYDRTESMFGGPGALLRLATLEAEDGERDLALAHIAGALERLARYPLAGTSGRILREKLERLRGTLVP